MYIRIWVWLRLWGQIHSWFKRIWICIFLNFYFCKAQYGNSNSSINSPAIFIQSNNGWCLIVKGWMWAPYHLVKVYVKNEYLKRRSWKKTRNPLDNTYRYILKLAYIYQYIWLYNNFFNIILLFVNMLFIYC